MTFVVRGSSLAFAGLFFAIFIAFCWTSANQVMSNREKREDPGTNVSRPDQTDWMKWGSDSGDAKSHQIAINKAGQIVIHADGVDADGAHESHGLIKMIFEKQICGAKADKMGVQPWIVMTINQTEGDCQKGVIFCYVGRLDLENEEHFGWRINTQFELSNEDGNKDIAEICEKRKSRWPSWENLTLHGFSLKVKDEKTNDGNTKIQLTTSTHRQSITYNATDDKVKLHLGSPGHLSGYVENRKQHQDFPKLMKQGILLRELDADLCLAYDLLMGIKNDTDLLGFTIPVQDEEDQEKKCQMSITIGGPGLRKYKGKNTAEKRKKDDKVNKYEQPKQVKVYENFFAPDNLVWITDNEDLPEDLKKDIFLEMLPISKKERVPRVVISSQGEERLFTVANRNNMELNFTWVRPVHDKFCVKAHQFEKNEMIFVYNKRPDCFVRFQWGERKAKCVDDMGFGDAVLSINDQPIFLHERDEFRTRTQFGEETQLCRGTCPMEADKIQKEYKGIPGMNDKDYLWSFVLYPNRERLGNEDVKAYENPSCVLAVAFDLREYNFFLPKDLYKDNKDN